MTQVTIVCCRFETGGISIMTDHYLYHRYWMARLQSVNEIKSQVEVQWTLPINAYESNDREICWRQVNYTLGRSVTLGQPAEDVLRSMWQYK
jgi:hypothetical protein